MSKHFGPFENQPHQKKRNMSLNFKPTSSASPTSPPKFPDFPKVKVLHAPNIPPRHPVGCSVPMRRVWPRWSPRCGAAASPRCAAELRRWSRWPSRPTRIAAAESFCLRKPNRRNTKFEESKTKWYVIHAKKKQKRKKERNNVFLWYDSDQRKNRKRSILYMSMTIWQSQPNRGCWFHRLLIGQRVEDWRFEHQRKVRFVWKKHRPSSNNNKSTKHPDDSKYRTLLSLSWRSLTTFKRGSCIFHHPPKKNKKTRWKLPPQTWCHGFTNLQA